MASGDNKCIFWVVIAVVGISYGQFPDAEYCSVPCSSGQHTMCKYKPTGPNCGTVKSFMNEDGRRKILSLHNSFRDSLANGKLKSVPGSSNMRQMYWDLELEAIAERWAVQCNASFNDECRNVNRFSVGQIMSKSNILSTSVNYYDALLSKLWFAEMHNLNPAIIGNYRGERQVKHIAQILSANTRHIGCADVLYTTNQNQKPVRVTVCNYGPVVPNNEQIYRIGKACTECPQRTECRGDGKYPHLCSELRHFDVVEPGKTYDVVQRDYDEEDIKNVVVESNIFRKGHKLNDYPKNRRKHLHYAKQDPSKWKYVVGGRGMEAHSGGSSSNDNEGEGVGVEDTDPASKKPSAGPSATDIPLDDAPTEKPKDYKTMVAVTNPADDPPMTEPDDPKNDKKGGDKDPGAKREGETNSTESMQPRYTTTFPTIPGDGALNQKPADIIYYFVGHGIIVWATIRLQN